MERAPPKNPDELDLSNLLNGEIVDEFGAELQIVADDIMDPNKKAATKRKVVLEVTILPNETRDVCTTSIQVYSQTPKYNPKSTVLFVGKSNGRACFSEKNAKQGDLFDPPQPHAVQGE